MAAKRHVKVLLDQQDVDMLKLDALLTHSTVSARLRELIAKHCKQLQLGQPRSMFAPREDDEVMQ